MNEMTPIYKALERRGAGKSLSPDFMARTMMEVARVQRRRKRAGLLWSVAACVLTFALAVTGIVYYCGGAFAEMFSEVAASARPDENSVGVIIMMLPSAAVLLLLDFFLRRHFYGKGSAVNEH